MITGSSDWMRPGVSTGSGDEDGRRPRPDKDGSVDEEERSQPGHEDDGDQRRRGPRQSFRLWPAVRLLLWLSPGAADRGAEDQEEAEAEQQVGGADQGIQRDFNAQDLVPQQIQATGHGEQDHAHRGPAVAGRNGL
jgi:hypothetical protein